MEITTFILIINRDDYIDHSIMKLFNMDISIYIYCHYQHYYLLSCLEKNFNKIKIEYFTNDNVYDNIYEKFKIINNIIINKIDKSIKQIGFINYFDINLDYNLSIISKSKLKNGYYYNDKGLDSYFFCDLDSFKLFYCKLNEYFNEIIFTKDYSIYHYLESFDFIKIFNKKLPSKYFYIYASISTIPSRINNLSLQDAIISIINQVDKVYINISKNVDNKEKINELINDENEKIIINYTEIESPFCKFDILKNNDYSWIFLMDDDQMYNPFLIEKMFESMNEFGIYQNKYELNGIQSKFGYLFNSFFICENDLYFFKKIPKDYYLLDNQWISYQCEKLKIPIYSTDLKLYENIFIDLENNKEKKGIDSISTQCNKKNLINQFENYLNIQILKNNKYIIHQYNIIGILFIINNKEWKSNLLSILLSNFKFNFEIFIIIKDYFINYNEIHSFFDKSNIKYYIYSFNLLIDNELLHNYLFKYIYINHKNITHILTLFENNIINIDYINIKKNIDNYDLLNYYYKNNDKIIFQIQNIYSNIKKNNELIYNDLISIISIEEKTKENIKSINDFKNVKLNNEQSLRLISLINIEKNYDIKEKLELYDLIYNMNKNINNENEMINYCIKYYIMDKCKFDIIYDLIWYFKSLYKHQLAFCILSLIKDENIRNHEYFKYRFYFEKTIINYYLNIFNKSDFIYVFNRCDDRHIINNTLKNLNYYNIYPFKNAKCLDLSEKFTYNSQYIKDEIFYSGSCSLLFLDDCNLLINKRCINYYVDEQKDEYDIKPRYYTINKSVIISKDKSKSWLESIPNDITYKMNDILENYMEYDEKNKERYITGIEDIRIYKSVIYNDIRYLASDWNNPNNVDLVNGIYDYKNKKLSNPIKLTHKNVTSVEKNWIYIPIDNKDCIVYKWYPIEIYEFKENEIELIHLKSINTNPLFKYVRGSTNFIKDYKDENNLYAITHLIDESRKIRSYYHMIVVLDSKTLELKKYSLPFRFNDIYRVQYCIGLEMINNEVLISFSEIDRSSKLIIISRDEFISIPEFAKNDYL